MAQPLFGTIDGTLIHEPELRLRTGMPVLMRTPIITVLMAVKFMARN